MEGKSEERQGDMTTARKGKGQGKRDKEGKGKGKGRGEREGRKWIG